MRHFQMPDSVFRKEARSFLLQIECLAHKHLKNYHTFISFSFVKKEIFGHLELGTMLRK
ncbi:hypothetical protein LEP1GSC128_2482 [Leptospira borgpetersenii str. 200801926]|uniref:Uncharacterized protein n=1 Tax=Leptospira borgpetersenii str. 200801926 TaxID=1193009 RepID=A0ABN0HXV3_LEPBO|nr:hypothetical protein LEP1GSC128_2482 [Leptospira borgpetersenii str. 200801926]